MYFINFLYVRRIIVRRRWKKGVDEKFLSYIKYVLRDDIDKLKGKWNLKFRNDNLIYVEFGIGKGKFIIILVK